MPLQCLDREAHPLGPRRQLGRDLGRAWKDIPYPTTNGYVATFQLGIPA
jgi:hypothetical protein